MVFREPNAVDKSDDENAKNENVNGDQVDHDSADKITLIAVTLGGTLFGALVGAIILPMLYGFAASFLDWNGKPPFLRWYCVLVGAGIGGIRAFLGALKQIRRQRATRDVAENLGMEYSSDVGDELEDQLSALFGDRGSISISNAVQQHVDSARFVVADMRHWRTTGSDSDSKVTHQTIAFFTSDQLHFPGFELQPEGRMVNLLTNMLGVEDIDFEDYAEFSRQYHLAGANPERIRRLFGDELLQHFSGNSGWQIKAAGNRLLMFRPRKQFDPSHLEEFIKEAMTTFSLFMAASYELQDAAEEAGGGSEQGPQASEPVHAMPGMLGAMARSLIVTPDELERFLAEPVPRKIPKNILRQRIGGGSLVAALLGSVFFSAGLILVGVALFGTQDPGDEGRTVMVILGTVFPVVGGTMAYFAWRYRRHNYRLLHLGTVAEGAIEGVERTGTKINDQRQYRLKVRYSDGLGKKRASTCNIYGRVAEEAQRRHQSQLPVRVLYDRNVPDRFLWADAFALPKF